MGAGIPMAKDINNGGDGMVREFVFLQDTSYKFTDRAPPK